MVARSSNCKVAGRMVAGSRSHGVARSWGREVARSRRGHEVAGSRGRSELARLRDGRVSRWHDR